ncbi:predicted protein [Scheffersomyces stipitis CBS 6054]|uniref:Uncharacterized protein n=1 Tax=Scheffersomyces stipitis (strain ATCC 58785 / CBS 6054 / NBRC 10063 / NRRL Y-11545) TaxID=322104 RepID=A3LN74_PICST|nr:predicted protein [Scheffersomyces stipitis CBS 6054]ABN64808.2 predicted protein [Scheffersomyces stipitis CBS 6054]
MDYGTVESYHEFLNQMESCEFNNSLINLATSPSPESFTPPIPSTRHLASIAPQQLLNLNLHLDVNTYYNKLTGLICQIPFHGSAADKDSFQSLAHNVTQSRTQKSFQETFAEDEEDEMNPLAPGLFPKLNIGDDEKFMKFDTLPLTPSYVAK